MKWLSNVLSKWFNVSKDPFYHCEVYKNAGCAHVDGPLCHVDTCDIRKAVLADAEKHSQPEGKKDEPRETW